MKANWEPPHRLNVLLWTSGVIYQTLQCCVFILSLTRSMVAFCKINLCFDRYGCFKLAELFVLQWCMLIGWDRMRFFFVLAINVVQNSPNLPWQSVVALTRVWIFRLFAPSSAYLGKSRQHKEVSSCRTCDFGLFPRIKLLSEMLFLCTQTHTRRRTLSLASPLIAQEILSAGGQLQAH